MRKERIRPLVFLGIVLAMVLGVTSAALADEPAVEVTEVEAPVGAEVVDEGEVIPRDDERPPAVEPVVEPEPDEPMVIAPADGIEEPMIVNPEGTIGIEENLIAPASGATGSEGWSADDWTVLGTSVLAALAVGAGVAFLATRQHYRKLLPH
jgi:hypothetical protein